MARPQKYSSAAMKQRAYRDRHRLGTQTPALPPKRPKRVSRPRRLENIGTELRDLADEYRSWLEAMPASLCATQLAEDLDRVIQDLESIADAVDALDPPRGFGR